MISSRLVLAAGSIAATLAGVVPAVSHDTTAPAARPVSVQPEGVSVSAGLLRADVASRTTVVVPRGISHLTGASSGSPALAARVRLTVTRTSDGATLFTGSLARFASLPVSAGDSLRVRVVRPTGLAGLDAAATLRWS